MTTTQLLDELKHLLTSERLAVVESVLHQIREDLSGADLPARLTRAALELRTNYAMGGDLTVWQ